MAEPVRERQKCEVYTRVVGYLRPTFAMNPGMKQQAKDRLEFTVPTREQVGLAAE